MKQQPLTTRIADAARDVFAAVRAAHPEERFYFFALYTTPDYSYVVATAASEEGTTRVAKQYVARYPDRDLATYEKELRFSAPDSPYHGLDAPELASLRGQRGLRAACFASLRQLDEQGLFGRGAERSRVIVNVVFGDMSDEQWLAHARELNPKASVARALPYLRLNDASGPVTQWGAAVYQVNALSFSADRSRLAYSGSGGEVGVYETANRRKVFARRRAGEHWANALSPDGNLLFLGDATGVLVIDVARRMRRRVLECSKPSLLRISPDGRSLVVASYEGTFGVHDARSGKVLFAPNLEVSDAAFSPDGSELALVTGEHLVVLTTETGRERLRVSSEGRAVAWTAGAIVVCVSRRDANYRLTNGSLMFFDARTGKLQRELKAPPCDGSIAVSPGGTRIALCADRALVVVDLEGRKVARGTGGQESLIRCGFIDDHRAVAVGRDVNFGPAVLEVAVVER